MKVNGRKLHLKEVPYMNQHSLSHLTAVLLACAIGVGFTSCGSGTRVIATVNGEEEIPAGLYVISQMQSVTEAQQSEDFDSSLTDIHENVIEEQDFDAWVLARSKEMVQEYAAIEAMFQEQGLTFSEDDEASVEYYVENMWPYYEEAYTEFGVSKDSYVKYVTNQYKYSDLFEARYGEGGSDAVSREEVTEQLEKDYAVVQVLSFSTVDSETGEAMSDSDTKAVYQEAQSYLQRAQNGEEMADLCFELAKAAAEDPASVEKDSADYLTTIKNGSAGAVVSSDLSGQIFESAEVGTPVLLSDDNGYYVVLRYPATEIETNYDTYKSDCLMTLKEEEFDQFVDDYAATMDISFNESAIKGLKLSKILE